MDLRISRGAKAGKRRTRSEQLACTCMPRTVACLMLWRSFRGPAMKKHFESSKPIPLARASVPRKKRRWVAPELLTESQSMTATGKVTVTGEGISNGHIS
jgi:hypothetical protein